MTTTAAQPVTRASHVSLRPLRVAAQQGDVGTCIAGSGTNSSSSDCAVSIAPAEAFNPLGSQHTVTFTCGASAGVLSFTPTVSNATLPTGCYDVKASLADATTGNAATFNSATCGKLGVPIITSSVNCSPTQNPVCAVGFATTNAGPCQPCPSGYMLTGSTCEGPPGADGKCPTGSTAVTNKGGSVAYCTVTRNSVLTPENTVVLTFNSSAPHVYTVVVTGYVGTAADGTCPTGTTLESNVSIIPTGSSPVSVVAACAFAVKAEKKYIEATSLTIIPIGTCTGALVARVNNVDFVSPCFFKVKATGTVILKTGVDCTNGTEPASGTSAVPAGFPTDPDSTIQPVYECNNNVLSVIGVGVPGIQVNLESGNGSFNPICIPVSRALALASTPTPTPSITPTATDTPLPTDTPIPGTPTPSPTPIPTPSPFNQPAACTAGPNTTTQSQTQLNGVGFAGSTNVSVGARIVAPPVRGEDVILQGAFGLGDFPASGFPMYGTIFYPTGTTFCDSGTTDSSGNATCRQATPTNGLQNPQYVPTDISFVANCQEYGFHTYFVDPNGDPPAASHQFNDPFCVIPTTFGTLSVRATFSSTINTQPPISTGDVSLAQAEAVTPNPTPATPEPADTATPLPTATATATATSVPTSTSTPTPTSTPIPPTATPTSTPTATVTPTPPPPLKFTLDAARLTRPKLETKREGVDQVTRGQKTSLVMYYTIKSMPNAVKRVTTYQVKDASGRTIFGVTFPPGTEDRSGQFARYTAFTVPTTLPFGVYTYRATLTLAKTTQTRTWSFAVVRGSAAVSAFTRDAVRAY